MSNSRYCVTKKRDRFGNRIGFVKCGNLATATKILEAVKGKKLLGVKLDLLLAHKDKSKTDSHRTEEKLEDFGKETKSKIPASKNEDGKEKKQQVPNASTNDQVTIDTLSKDCFKFSKIGFTLYPMSGVILNQILEEMKIRGVEVKEVTCWKFIFSFPSQEKCNAFDWNMLKDWVNKVRNPCREDLMIKRQAIVEVRGLPFNSWTESSLRTVIRNIGLWGWWINRPDTIHKLEAPKICVYTDNMENFNETW